MPGHRHQDIYPTLTITGDIVNLAIFGNGHMTDHLKCIFCMFQLNNAFIGFHTTENTCVDTKIFILRLLAPGI